MGLVSYIKKSHGVEVFGKNMAWKLSSKFVDNINPYIYIFINYIFCGNHFLVYNRGYDDVESYMEHFT